MGANMVRRLMKGGHQCVVFDKNAANVSQLESEGARGSSSLDDFVRQLTPPRTVWMMVPVAVVDPTLEELAALLTKGDTVIDGGNSNYTDDIRRAQELQAPGLYYVDVGVSGGVWGLERGYCQMIGGEREAVERLHPIFRTLAPGRGNIPRTMGREKVAPSTAEEGFLHCGPSGAGHFVKMVHNGIEYGMMAALSEGLNVLKNADEGKRHRTVDAETTPMRHPEHYQYELPLPEIAEVWRRGSVIVSWLLDLVAVALLQDAGLGSFSGHVADSGEGRWTVNAAIDESVPVPVLSAALFQRFASRGEADFADKLLSAMRFQFGGHQEKPASGGGNR